MSRCPTLRTSTPGFASKVQEVAAGWFLGGCAIRAVGEYAEWYQIGFELVNGEFVYYVNGVPVFTDTDVNGSESLQNVILQGYNTQTGVDYDIYWDDFTTNAADVPEPMTITAFGLMLAGGGMYVRRRKVATAA